MTKNESCPRVISDTTLSAAKSSGKSFEGKYLTGHADGRLCLKGRVLTIDMSDND